jgi:phosphoribosylamine---glycine ligase
MKVLVIGTGGREHAILKSLKSSSQNPELFIYPGNDGHADCAELVVLPTGHFSEIVDFCRIKKINFVFIGPENELVDGLTDQLRAANVFCVGPNKEAAQLEGSKIFSKNFMNEFKIPTAKHQIVTNHSETLEAALKFKPPFILKADGLAAGKGVYICKNLEELTQASHEIFNLKKFGAAGNKAILEENLPGFELSVLVLTNGEDYSVLPLAQDHKRLKDQNLGPNTGGMGTVAPMSISESLRKKIVDRIIEPTIHGFKNKNFLYRGILFIGVMVVNDEPFVLEYNVRFGDPETQVILPLIKNDAVDLFYQLSQGHLQPIELKPLFTACVVNAAKGYPDHAEKGAEIKIPIQYANQILFCGVKKNKNNKLQVHGGRVLNIVTQAANLQSALMQAYEINAMIDFDGRQYRSDIGKSFNLPAPT